MKNLAAKLKGMNYKQAVIDHGEKLFLGVIGLFVLMCLAGTSWSRYDKQPKEFQDKVEQGERNIQNSAWTPERRKEFESARDIMQAVSTLHSPLEPGRYEYSTSWFWPMYPAVRKIVEPKWLAPIQPIADFGKAVIVELPPEQPQLVAATVEGSTEAKKIGVSEDDDEFALKRNSDLTGRNPNAAAGATSADATAIAGAGATDPARVIGGAAMPGMSGMSGPQVLARGNRFVSVRAVFPLGDQLEELVKTMHETKQKAADLVQFVDFEVQRQVAQPGDKPWSGDWEKVDLQATLDLLDRIEFDADLVDPAYTDNVFTMPLPRRVVGRWAKWASHPLIKTMTDEQAELTAQLNAKLVEEAAKKKLEDKTAKKGFAQKVHDARGLRGQFSGQMPGMINEMQKDMGSGSMMAFNPMFGGDAMREMGSGSVMAGFNEQITRTGNGRMSKYLLFRYFDFQVNPGNAYRYRVRMTLLNPNFRRPVEELVDESIAAGELRVTPWSEPTPHVFVPEEQRIFLAKADKARVDTGLPSASLDVYQWFSEAGTTIAAKIDKLQLGQFVGGHAKTEVFRPAGDTLKEEDVPVFTGSLLTDAASAPTATDFDFSEHPDLKLDAKKLKQLGTADKALVVDRYGQIAMLDTKAASDEKSAADKIVENERRGVRARIKDRPQTGADGAGGDITRLYGSGSGSDPAMADPMGGGMGAMMPGMSGGNVLKKGAKPAMPKKGPKNKGGGSGSGSSSSSFGSSS